MGGPAVHIAMMEEEVVTRRAWLTRDELLDFLGATNLILVRTRPKWRFTLGADGWLGLVVAGVSFILPAALMVVALAWAYLRFGALPQIAALLYGVKPVMIVVIAQGAYRLARSAVKWAWLAVLGAVALAAPALGIDPLATLFGAGILPPPRFFRQEPGTSHVLAGAFTALALTTGSLATPFSVVLLFLMMLKIGATLFGGGYVLVAFLRSDLVTRLHWLTERELLEAVAAARRTLLPSNKMALW